IVLAIVLQPLVSLLPVPGLTAPFILACWLLQLGTHARRRPLAQLRASP
ncbi:urea transporter, partial [Pseudomonas sp. MAFF212427]|nr:urea transporter [Pseudomonas brassicae]